MPEPGDPQDLNRYTYVRNNPVRYSDPSGYCIPDECPWVPKVSHPGDYTGPYDESYDAWLVQSILWLEREWAATGGLLGIREAQQSIATELAHRVMHSDDPAVYSQQMLQGLAGSGVDIATWAADKGAAFMSSFAGWVLGQVRMAGRSGRLPEVISGTRIVWPSKPHNPRGGHWNTIVQETMEMAASGEYVEIYVNKAISTATGGQVQSRLRPDIIGVRKSGGYDVVEVVSPSQRRAQLERKINSMKQDLFGALMVNGKMIEP